MTSNDHGIHVDIRGVLEIHVWIYAMDSRARVSAKLELALAFPQPAPSLCKSIRVPLRPRRRLDILGTTDRKTMPLSSTSPSVSRMHFTAKCTVEKVLLYQQNHLLK